VGIVDVDRITAVGREMDEKTLGRQLFELTAAARVNGLDPEGALRLHATKLMQQVESGAAVTPTAAK
jgi:XTP/dITP diphosphohydrolase/tetrapyrrole methylase family protein/MazG family protein